jgi:DNA repair protein RadC
MTTNDTIPQIPSDTEGASVSRSPYPSSPPLVTDTATEPSATAVLPSPEGKKHRRAPPTRISDGCDGETTICSREVDLLAVLLGTGTRRAGAVLAAVGGLRALGFARETDLATIGIRPERARLMVSAIELGRRTVGEAPRVGHRIGNPSEVWHHLQARLSGLPVEEFWAIALDVRNRVLFDECCARGSLTGVEVHPRDVFRLLIRGGAAAVIFVHCHPSGDPSPSRQDLEMTTRLRQVGELCGIAVLDHIVVAAGGYVSIADRGWC